MKMFASLTSEKYFKDLVKKIIDDVDKMSDEEILGYDFNNCKEYIYSHYFVQPINLFENKSELNLEKCKFKEPNYRYKYGLDEHKYYEINGYCILFKVFYEGRPDLLKLKPNRSILKDFSCIDFTNSQFEGQGSFTLKYKYRKDVLDNADDVMELVNKKIEDEFKHYKTMIENINEEVNYFNESILNLFEEQLNKRQAELSSFLNLSKKLEIPVQLNRNILNIKPKAIPIQEIKPPSQKNVKRTEYSIPEFDYKKINDIIYMMGTSMEKQAKTFYRNNEEEIRDHFLATLNTHYDNVSGETFRKIGKTDILIEFKNKSAFIAECKIWHGGKQFSKAIKQLFNYSVWRDSKLSVILFNKNNLDFLKIIKSIDSWVAEHSKSYDKPNKNEWKCKYYRTDRHEIIDLSITIFDLYVDTSQFKDNRY